MTLVLVLLYVLSGELKLEQIPVKDQTECQIKGGKRAAELTNDPRFDTGLFIGCIQIKSRIAEK